MHKRFVVMTMVLAAAALLPLGAQAQDAFPSVSVAEKVMDSVVSIDSNSVAYGALSGIGGFETSRTGSLATRRQTGFVISADGYIITDSTDIQDAALIVVRTADGRELNGEVIGIDEYYGIGVVKVESDTPLKPVQMIDAMYDPINEHYPYDQGDSVVAIGYSGGYGGTVTYGIISAIRNLRNRGSVLVPSMIQADVVINYGNEGCPLFDDQGRVIAMHERRGGGGSMQNTTFFTPIWLINRAAQEIIADYAVNPQDIEVWHPWIGVKPFSGTQSPFGGLRTVGDDLKMYMNIPYQYWDTGILLDTVYPESPAQEFGLQDKDLLMTLEIRRRDDAVKVPYFHLKTIEELELLVTTADEGDLFIFGVLRDGRFDEQSVQIGQHPGSFVFFGGFTGGVENSAEYF